MTKFHTTLSGLILGVCLGFPAAAQDAVALNPDRPDRYVVQEGDTLWDIAGRFLREPWGWPTIWEANPQLGSPHKIYPGDTLVLVDGAGGPRLQVAGRSAGGANAGADANAPWPNDGGVGSTVKLHPSVRETPIEDEVPAIPIDAVNQFLGRPYVLTKEQYEASPYVLAFGGDRIIGGSGHTIYVRSIEEEEGKGEAETQHTRYDLVRLGEPYEDPETGEILGYEGIFIGEADLQAPGDPATLAVRRVEKEVLEGDRLMAEGDAGVTRAFYPKGPDTEIEASIISVMGGVTQAGRFDVVVLNKGADDGLQRGDVLVVYRAGQLVKDRVSEDPWDEVQLPDRRAGMMMVFRTFERLSFALVMGSEMALHVGDHAVNP